MIWTQRFSSSAVLRILVLVDHVLVDRLAHQLAGFRFRPGRAERGQVLARIAVQLQLVMDQIVDRRGRRAACRQSIFLGRICPADSVAYTSSIPGSPARVSLCKDMSLSCGRDLRGRMPGRSRSSRRTLRGSQREAGWSSRGSDALAERPVSSNAIDPRPAQRRPGRIGFYSAQSRTERPGGYHTRCPASAWVASDPDPEPWTAIGFGLVRHCSLASVPAFRPGRRNSVIEMTATASVSRFLDPSSTIFSMRRSARTETACCSAFYPRSRVWMSTLGRRPPKLAQFAPEAGGRGDWPV